MKYITSARIVPILLLFYAQAIFLPVNAQSAKSPYERLLETQREYEKAIVHGDSAEISELCYLMGKRHIGIGNYPKAQQWLLRSLSMREHLGLSEDVGKIHLRMSEIQSMLKNPKKTMYHARQATINFRQARVPNGLMAAYRALGGAFKLDFENNPVEAAGGKSLDSAIYYHEKSLNVAMSIKKPLDIAISYQGLGQFWSLKKDLKKGEDYLRKALYIYHQMGLSKNIMEASLTVADELLRQNKPLLARRWLNDASRFSTNESTTPGLKKWLQECLATYYEQTKEWKLAYYHEQKASDLNAKHFEHYRSEALQNIEAAFESERKSVLLTSQKKQLDLQQKNLKIQNRLNLITFVLLGMAVVISGAFFFLFKRYKSLSNQNAILVKEQNHRTKNNLQSILDLLSLHMLRIANPTARMALEESLLRVEAISLVHQKLYNSDQLIHVDLATYIPDLITGILRSYRLQDTVTDYQVQDIPLHVDKAITLGLIVNELTTNACKYALRDNANAMLQIRCFIKDEKLYFIFTDNGPGFVSETGKNTFGTGLITILLKKLKANGGFLSDKPGCQFELSFPYTKKAALAGITQHELTPAL